MGKAIKKRPFPYTSFYQINYQNNKIINLGGGENEKHI